MPHKALWIKGDATQEIKYIEGGYTPGEDELLLKCICVGVNPGDWKYIQRQQSNLGTLRHSVR
jgi:NADPH:quinone reductase-like Zn-dependent oxidoreductase